MTVPKFSIIYNLQNPKLMECLLVFVFYTFIINLDGKSVNFSKVEISVEI